MRKCTCRLGFDGDGKNCTTRSVLVLSGYKGQRSDKAYWKAIKVIDSKGGHKTITIGNNKCIKTRKYGNKFPTAWVAHGVSYYAVWEKNHLK